MNAAEAQEPDQQQRGGDDVEAVQKPDWSQREAEDVDGVHCISHVAQREVAEAVGVKIPCAEGLEQHGQVARCEEDGGNHSCEN